MGYKFQTQWGKNRGILLLLAMYTGAMGGGAYLISIYLAITTSNQEFIIGAILGFLLLAIGKPVFHIMFLGRPERFLKAFSRPNSSWISRGIWGLTFFMPTAGIYIAPYMGIFTWLRGTLIWQVGLWASIPLAFFLIMYDGFLLVASKGIAIWNNSLLAILFPVAAFISGLGVLIFYAAYFIGIAEFIEVFEEYELTILLLGAFTIATYLYSVNYGDTTSKYSVYHLVKGKYSALFWFSLITAIALPILTNILGRYYIHIPIEVIGLVALLELIGDLTLKYTILNVGVYRPLVDMWSRESIYDESYRVR